jgi:hypothetical protein
LAGCATNATSSSPVGSGYTISGCSGVTLGGGAAGDYQVGYSYGAFSVTRATIHVTVSGSQTVGGTPTFTKTDDAPSAITLSGSLACTQVDPATSIAPALPGGTYTVAGFTCSGLTPSDTTDYLVTYSGAAGGFVVSKAQTSLQYNQPNFVSLGSSFRPSALLSSVASPCVDGQNISFTLDAHPVTGVAGAFALESATTSAGQATGAAINTSGWKEGVYTITASYAGTTSCYDSSDSGPLSIAAPGASASGGGWYNLSGSGRINFGFTVRQTSRTANTYAGQLVLINTGKWRIKAALSAYGKTGTTAGSAAGIGDLYWWNQQLSSGGGGWQLAKSGVAVTINFGATTGGKKVNPGNFGTQISYKSSTPQPSTLPNSAPQLLKGGNVNVS